MTFSWLLGFLAEGAKRVVLAGALSLGQQLLKNLFNALSKDTLEDWIWKGCESLLL